MMTPPNRSTALALALAFCALTGSAAAEEGAATPAAEAAASKADLARLTAVNEKLTNRFEKQLQARVDEVIEAEVGDELVARTTMLLERRLARTAPELSPTPAAPARFAVRTAQIEPASNTTCRLIAGTLDCVLRSPGTR